MIDNYVSKESFMNKKITRFIVLGLMLFLHWNCKKANRTKTYLHLSHTRTEADDTIDSLTLKIDFDEFDMLWLGGDLTYYTSKKAETLAYADSIYNIKNQNTLWALGNHDYADTELVQKFTKRPPYYTYHENGITFMVLDTQDSLSNIFGKQLDFFQRVTDTLKTSSHLVILHHKLIWLYGHPALEAKIPAVSNAGLGDCFVCLNPNNFYTDLYPQLLEIEKKGIEVLCVAGDIGTKIKEFEYRTPEGIDFLASGIESGEAGNKALVFQHDLSARQITWTYQLIGDLIRK